MVSICSVHEMRVPRADIREVKPGLEGPLSTFPFFTLFEFDERPNTTRFVRKGRVL